MHANARMVVRAAACAPRRALPQMLIASELDASYSPPRPCRYHAVKWPDRAAVSGHLRHRAPVFPGHAHVPAAAPDRAAA